MATTWRAADWSALTIRSLSELSDCDEAFHPTSFWGPGLDELMGDLETRGLETFKSWPTAGFWFYPRYGAGFTNELIDLSYTAVADRLTPGRRAWVAAALNGSHEARRDFDALRLTWDQDRWPCDLEGVGESRVGSPYQYYRFTGEDHGWTRPSLNYGLCLAALSRHVVEPPRRFLEIGGGFGALGEFVLSRDPEAVYVGVDIPPLLTVSSWYLTQLFGDRIQTYDDSVPPTGPIAPASSAVLPNFRLPDLTDDFDVFVNSFSFQEMEPHVVEHYIDLVVARGIRYAVSLNSRLGKPKRTTGNAIGVIEPVTSSLIIDLFTARGFELLGAYDSPVVSGAGQLAVLGRR